MGAVLSLPYLNSRRRRPSRPQSTPISHPRPLVRYSAEAGVRRSASRTSARRTRRQTPWIAAPLDKLKSPKHVPKLEPTVEELPEPEPTPEVHSAERPRRSRIPNPHSLLGLFDDSSTASSPKRASVLSSEDTHGSSSSSVGAARLLCCAGVKEGQRDGHSSVRSSASRAGKAVTA